MSAPQGPLVSVEELAARLGDSELRIYDCTVDIVPRAGGAGISFDAVTSRERWAAQHIPGAAFADLVALTDNGEGRWMMLPAPETFAAAVGKLGIGEGSRVVLYDSGMNMWAARMRWMLKVHGFDDAAVLDGGWQAWTEAGQAVSSHASSFEPAVFTPCMRPELVASTEEVASTTGDPAVALVNAVGHEQHLGRGKLHVGRRGHIPTSVNVPYSALVAPDTHAYLTPDALGQVFAAQGVGPETRTVAYCGGAIAACSAALALELIGAGDVAVYDGSLREWAIDPDRPLVTG